MKRFLLLLFFVFIPSAWSAESVSQRTSAQCSPVVGGVTGNVEIKIICKQGVDPTTVKLILRLLNDGLPRLEEQQRQILEILASKVLDTQQLEEIIAIKHAALFNSSQEEAAKWAKDLVESSKAIFDRYNIVSEADLARATERLQAHLKEQPRVPVVVPIIIASTKTTR